jgi:mannitol/fructose-specific phosphotransferase system IIA component (Ntr-type)
MCTEEGAAIPHASSPWGARQKTAALRYCDPA